MDLRAAFHHLSFVSSSAPDYSRLTRLREGSLCPEAAQLPRRFPGSHRQLQSNPRSHPFNATSSKNIAPETDGDAARKERPIRTLLIDNYDSYTYNLYQLLSVINGVPPKVIRNDEMCWDQLHKLLYKECAFDNIVLSPGPGSPACAKDIGLCLQVLKECVDIPILGVCLGHQALGYVNGAKVVHAPEPVHGRLSEVQHNGCPIFDGIPSGRGSGFQVVRYHSLMLDPDSLPSDLVPTAWAVDSCRSVSRSSGETLDLGQHPGWVFEPLNVRENTWMQTDSDAFPDKLSSFSGDTSGSNTSYGYVIMAVSHRKWPHYGVQFHPESVATSFGKQILKNFRDLTVQFQATRRNRRNSKVSVPLKNFIPSLVSSVNSGEIKSSTNQNVRPLKLYWEKVERIACEAGGSEGIFCGLYGEGPANDTFWLDSSLQQGDARFSFMGGKGGRLWKRLVYWMPRMKGSCPGTLKIEHEDFVEEVEIEGFLDFLSNELQSYGIPRQESRRLPFDFWGGFIGYLGYELKEECGAACNRHKSHHPDASFFFVDRFLAVDHLNNDVYVVALYEDEKFHSGPHNGVSVNGMIHKSISESLSAQRWVKQTVKQLNELSQSRIDLSLERRYSSQLASCSVSDVSPVKHFTLYKSKAQYMDDVKSCLSYIRDGESYELCLTTQLHKNVKSVDKLGLYLTLRRMNPAPYAAWLNFGSEDLSICSSSPERFLRLDQSGVLEAKPIKGTVPRGRSPAEDEKLKLKLQLSDKDQAENLMIVDLLRNDLGRVCTPGSVHVPSLMAVESYATVHTMVSTIRGTKRLDVTPVDCVRAAFPGGSMTGAPKIRSMEILDKLESGPRGIYSGSIGFFSVNSSFDLNIVIRTLVIHKGVASIGAGGAVVALSDPSDEYEEMLLKTKAPIRAVSQMEALASFISQEFESESLPPALLGSH